MTILDDIPSTATPPADARPSGVLARIRSYRPGRRALLRGLVIGAAGAALVPVDWFLARREASAQPGAGSRSEHTTCKPAQYREQANNWWSGGPAVCYGGFRRGSFPCTGGFHREGSFSGRGESYVSTRVTTSCSGRNAWRWEGHRCSDAMTTTTYEDGSDYSGLTIAACAVAGSRGGAGGFLSGGGSTGESRDVSRPLRFFADAGTSFDR